MSKIKIITKNKKEKIKMKELVMYRCEVCGNLICMIEDSGIVPECCGSEMTRIVANVEDASAEKHVPVVQRNGLNVQILVGGLPHPMTPAHHISCIILLTTRGVYMRRLKNDDAAEAIFNIRVDEDVISVYAWCNLHGLWKSDSV